MKELRSQVGRRFLVLPEHKEPFQRELNALMAMKTLADKFALTHWLFRFFLATGSVFRAEWFIDRRHYSRWQTFKFASKVAIVFSTPDWLSSRLAIRWKRDHRAEREARRVSAQSRKGDLPKGRPVLPSATASALL